MERQHEAARVHGPKPPTSQRVSIEALFDAHCGFAVVRSRKSLSANDISADLTLSVCAVTPAISTLPQREDSTVRCSRGSSHDNGTREQLPCSVRHTPFPPVCGKLP
jgi:hypothetical protein